MSYSIASSSIATGAWRTFWRITTIVVLAIVALGVERAFTAGPSAPSAVVTIDPARILDTREPIGVPAAGPVGPDTSITVKVAGEGGVPLTATGVILTLTAAEGTADTFITATPTGTPRATTSVLNPGPGKAIANTITIALGTDGQIDLYNKFGDVHLIADVAGYLVPESTGPSGPRVENGAIELTAYGAMARNMIGPVRDFGCLDLGNGGDVVLDVPLPHGAAVTSVTFRYKDTDTAEMQFVLYEINDVNNVPTVSGTLSNNQVESNILSGYGEVVMNPTGGDKVSDDVRYIIESYTPGQNSVDSVHEFCGATVKYARIVG